ncbi:MAG: iron-sulfur cluster assembly scaffold protein [Armatimonadota bacterium]|nr:iron-sulfur cluster assembly scaffold protein [Armatimonadota bacterium]
MAYQYTETVLDHFRNPRNVGDLPDADVVGEVSNPVCGDTMRVALKLDEEGRIVDVRFKTFGCAAAIAASSMATEMMKGKTLEEALRDVTRESITAALGGLPEAKVHCSVLASDALADAAARYRQKVGTKG